MKRPMTLILALLTALVLILSGCGSGGGSSNGDGAVADRDGDGVPNEQDSFPDDPTGFANFATVLLNLPAGGQFGAAVAVNNGDQVVGLADDGTGVMRAVKWTVSGTTSPNAVILPSLEPNGYNAAYGIDDAGVAVGEAESGGNFVAVAWASEDAAPNPLSLAGFAPPAAAYGISDGRIVGEVTADGNRAAVLWNDTAAAPVLLGTLGGESSAAYYINGAGMIVGESLNGEDVARGVVWFLDGTGIPSAPVPLDPLEDHVASVALGINTAGEVVGESESASGEVHAVLWTLDPAGLPGPPLDLGPGSASAVNDANRVAGSSTPQAVVRDTRNASLANAILSGSFNYSQAYGLNDGNLVVGLADNQGFVAVPQ